MSSKDHSLYRLRSIALTAVVGAFVFLAVTPAADAHGTLNLYGKTATANRNGTLTLTIPHGCGSNDTAGKGYRLAIKGDACSQRESADYMDGNRKRAPKQRVR
ncbi:MAG: hypothetical protein NT122_06755 [Solirubrobacterales bacterium]|nr:hypothetical protein [Solirubrobacterales bacterium]